MSHQEPRIPNLPPEQWTPEVEALFPIAVPKGAPVKGSDFNSILMLATHPPLAAAWLTWSTAIGVGWLLPPRLKEIAILRVAWLYGAAYEWTHHVILGQPHGLTNAHFEALKGDPAAPLWSDVERWVIRAVDDNVERRQISQETWNGLATELDHKQILELLFTIGSYMALSVVFNGAIVPPEQSFVDLVAAQGLLLVEG